MQNLRFFCSIITLPLLVNSAHAQTLTPGIDVSHHQGVINWTQVKNSGIQFAFAKATEGVNFVDSRFTANMAGATAAGVMIGPYHFCRVDSLNGVPFTSYDGLPFQPGTGPYIDAVSEAQDFLDAIMPYYQTNQYLPPVADVESLPNFGSSTLNRLFISNWVQLFSDTINSTLGVRPLIYTNLSHANSVYEPDVAATHDLWLAWWKGTGTSNPPVPSDTPAWPKYKFWQWTNASSVPGISGNVDGDVFNGTLAQLQQLLIGPASTPVTPFANKVNITDFESGEGYFNWSTSASGSNQGILAGSAADRVTTEAHDGDGSQRINIVGNAGGWFLRHLSGIGSPPASPDTNLTLDAEGYLGFWLKTTNPGITVQLALDDPGSAIDRGLAQNVIADGRWHLYEWDLGDDSQWQAWTSLADGTIGGATVTIDSIQFTGAGNAVIYLDSVAHNPNGSLLPDPGDFDYDGDVDNDDLTAWEAGYGTSSGASMDSGDADGDGDVDGADYLAFQSHFTGSLPLAAAAAAVPEPVSTGLFLVGLLALSAARLSR